ncbi:MAG: energy-coupling factor ABC transporter permease [Promethearchaeota archaeon]|nr:MAG: energy-coupling factor ABC transporter permease [Candidatus Lokiarchaeota archaeon]
MHFPDGLLDPITTISLWIIVITIMILGYFRMGRIFEKEDSDKLVPYIGVLAAVIFAFQFVNYPVPGGTSGHLIGGTLIAVILGPWASVIILFLVLVVQSLFGDGGILALGANTFNMGIIGGIVGFYIVLFIVKILNKTSLKKEVKFPIATAIGSYIAIILASFICGIELGFAGAIPFEIAIPAMVYWHLLIGIGEAIISALIIFYIYKVKPDFITTESIMINKVISLNISRYKKPIISVLMVIGTLMLMIAVGFTIGILSNAPDGLERVLIDQNGESWLESLVSPFVPLFNWITNDYGAAIIGITLSVIVMASVFYLIIKYKKKNLISPADSYKSVKNA